MGSPRDRGNEPMDYIVYVLVDLVFILGPEGSKATTFNKLVLPRSAGDGRQL